MTSTAREPVRVHVAPPRGAPWVELVWDLSTRAGRALAAQRDLAETVVAVVIRIESSHGAAQATIRLEALTGGGERLALAEPRVHAARWMREERLEHVDIEGVVQCTIRHGPEPRVLFARSPLFASLAITPGAYLLRPVCEERP